MKTLWFFHWFCGGSETSNTRKNIQTFMILEEKPCVFFELKYAKTPSNFTMLFQNINLMFQCAFGPRGGGPPPPNMRHGTLTFIDTDPYLNNF